MMPQWDFLDFLADGARPYDTFKLLMQAEVTDLLWDGERVAGVTAQTPEGWEIRADLVVGADGRHSLTRQKAKLEVINLGAPMDVLWMRISRQPSDPDQTFGRIEPGRMFVTINRSDYWQCAYVIPKGAFQTIERNGLAAFRADIARLAPHLGERVGELASWDDVKLLTVAVDRLRQWYRPGFLCIADAAHAMSPIGGVGINLAIQDAVAAANILAARCGPGAETDHLRGATAAGMADPPDPGTSGLSSGSSDQPRSGEPRERLAAVARAARAGAAPAAEDTGPPRRHRLPARACAGAGGARPVALGRPGSTGLADEDL